MARCCDGCRPWQRCGSDLLVKVLLQRERLGIQQVAEEVCLVVKVQGERVNEAIDAGVCNSSLWLASGRRRGVTRKMDEVKGVRRDTGS